MKCIGKKTSSKLLFEMQPRIYVMLDFVIYVLTCGQTINVQKPCIAQQSSVGKTYMKAILNSSKIKSCADKLTLE